MLYAISNFITQYFLMVTSITISSHSRTATLVWVLWSIDFYHKMDDGVFKLYYFEYGLRTCTLEGLICTPLYKTKGPSSESFPEIFELEPRKTFGADDQLLVSNIVFADHLDFWYSSRLFSAAP